MIKHSHPRARSSGDPAALLGAGLAAPGRAGVRRTVGPGAGPGPATGRSGAGRASGTPRPEQYPGTAKTTDIPIDDGRRRRPAGRPDPAGERRGRGDRQEAPGDRDDHRLQQDRDRGGHRRAGRPGSAVPGQARLQLPLRRRPRHRQLRGHLGGVQRPGEQGRRQDRRLGAPPVVEQRQGRHGRRVLHGHQPADGRRPPPARSQGDLPAGSRRRRLPRHRRRPAASSTSASSRCGSAWSTAPA